MAAYPLSIFVYPVFPLPNITYRHLSGEKVPISLAIDNFEVASDFGFTLRWALSAPDGSSTSENSGTYGVDHQNLVDNDSISVYTSYQSLPPGLYSLTWKYTWTTCYTLMKEYKTSVGKNNPIKKKMREKVEDTEMTVTGSYSFILDAGNGTETLSEDDLSSPEEYGPGTLIAEIIGPHEEEEDCPVINPDDRNSSVTRSAEPTRTIPNDPVPQRATVTEVVETSLLSMAAPRLERPEISHLVSLMLCILPLVFMWQG